MELPTASAASVDDLDLSAPAAGRPLRIVLLTFYNYTSYALRIFHPLLKQRGHEVHSVYFKDSFTYGYPTQQEEDMLLDRIEEIGPEVLAVQVWSTYFQLAARVTRRVKERTGAVAIWGGIHAQVRPEQCLEYADVVCRSEGEYVLAELTDRIGLGEDYSDLRGCWVKRGGEIIRNAPRLLINDLDLLPLPDFSADDKHYLGDTDWIEQRQWHEAQLAYDIMMVRGCPFECTFCIHNFTRKVSVGLGKYVRRRGVDHCMHELAEGVRQRPHVKTIAFSDDIFCPPKPWLEEFCARYKKEIGLPFVIWTFPRMVDEERIKILRDAGLWCATMGIQSGSERIRRDCYERETTDEEIVNACEIMDRNGVQRNLDFIGDNPYEDDSDRRATVNLLLRLPKPFYFNYFSLTYFPGVELTDRALRDGFIKDEHVEDVAQKGYQIWAGTLSPLRSLEDLRWDVAYMMAVYRFPSWAVNGFLDSSAIGKRVQLVAEMMRRVRSLTRWKAQIVTRLTGQLVFPSAS